MFMYKKEIPILSVTNRKLCREDFLSRIERIAAANPAGIILREKDLSEEEYRSLAEQVLNICRKQGTPCILHSFYETALELECDSVHLPLPVLMGMESGKRKKFRILGASCHSAEDAVLAEKMGCWYITAGHVFETDCKKGLPGRGMDFLEQVCRSVSVPVYAIGGITAAHMGRIRQAGAAGACVMSGLMTCGDPKEYLEGFKE